MRPKKMSLKEYKNWIQQPIARKASQPKFFPTGVKRTINVLEGDAHESSVNKWKSFGARHFTQYKNNPTERRRIALRNWGFDVNKVPGEKDNVK